MSIQAVAWALEQDMPARPKLVLVSLGNHADHRTGYCWLKAETIGEEASCSPRAVFNFIGDLIRNGYVRKAIRKSEDGKQRANDYWIVFDRAPTEWISDRTQSVVEDEESDGGDAAEIEATDAISSSPHAPRSTHTNTTDDSKTAAAPVDMSAGASGPHATRCQRKSLDEPSKIKPKDTGANVFSAAPRKYHAPPLAPQGAVSADASKPIFVYRGTPAWDAWMAHKKATTGIRPDDLTSTLVVDGEKRTGWWFPTMYPPRRETGKESGEDDDPELAALQESRMHR